nr:hypothetical protein [Tanacetum cinerariifolium]
MCLDDSELDTEIPERHVSPTPHDAMLTRWRSRVSLRSSSPTTSIPEIPIVPILPAPSAIVAPSSKTSRCSEAYLRWRSAPLSNMYPPTTSESSAGDSSSESSAGPSRKRCRSLATTWMCLDVFGCV